MLFNKENYPTIKEACLNRREIQFEARLEDTGFAGSDDEVPKDWEPFPPTALPPAGYAQVFALASNDARGHLTRLELLVHLDGGRVFYKTAGEGLVSLKVIWTT